MLQSLKKGVILLAIVWSLILAGAADAVTPDISDTIWDMSGKVSTSVKKVGRMNVNGSFNVVIGPDVDAGLGDFEWKMTDPEGDVLGGTYHERTDSPGKGIFHFSFDALVLNDYIEQKLLNAADEGDVVVVDSIENVSVTSYPKSKSNRKGLSLNVDVKIAAHVTGTVNGQDVAAGLAIKIKAGGLNEITAIPDMAQGSSWMVALGIKFNLPRLGRNIDESTFILIIGPDPVEALGDNEWMAVSDDGEEIIITGTFTRTKNSITIMGLEEHLRDLIWENIEQLAQDEGLFDFQLQQVNLDSLKATATIKPETWIKLNIAVKFNGVALVEGEMETGKGTYTEKGIGVPYNPVQ